MTSIIRDIVTSWHSSSAQICLVTPPSEQFYEGWAEDPTQHPTLRGSKYHLALPWLCRDKPGYEDVAGRASNEGYPKVPEDLTKEGPWALKGQVALRHYARCALTPQ